MVRRSYTAVVERDALWQGGFATEPYECAWAGEAIFFIRTLESHGRLTNAYAHVQVSPDGMHWCHEGTRVQIPQTGGLTFCRVSHFGGYLRLAGEMPSESWARVIVYLVLKE